MRKILLIYSKRFEYVSVSKDDSNHSAQITIARWSDRFFAWLIDYIIVFAGAFAVFFMIIYIANFENIINYNFAYERTFEWAPLSLVFFSYWLILESKRGQSIGKIILHIKVTNLVGGRASIKGILISSFGKSFLLPVDLILGWIFTNKKRQRIFNKLGSTIVIKLDKVETEPENISYKMD